VIASSGASNPSKTRWTISFMTGSLLTASEVAGLPGAPESSPRGRL
jgi:hypothetical protein